MVLLWSVLNLLLAVVSLAEELVEQTHVPVLMWSHHVYVIRSIISRVSKRKSY